ncbi:MAG TPA: DUF934 domain-containing protein [Rhodocyclaceae bacterium]
MAKIIKNQAVVNDDWSLLQLAEGEDAQHVAIPVGKLLVPLAVWKARHDELLQRKHHGDDLGVWLAPEDDPAAIAGDLAHFAVIGVMFPVFRDGRGYSTAMLLRSRYGYRGELRAIGDVLRDQLFYMQRVGFDAFAIRADRSAEDALAGLSDFSEVYQASWNQPQPLFRRRAA